MIHIKQYFQIALCILLICVIGCNSSDFNWHFKGDSKELLLSKTDVPFGWDIEAETINQLPVPGTENRSVTYNLPPDSFLTNSLIAHHIIIFDNSEQATEFMNADYQVGQELVKQAAKGKEVQWPEFTPPPRHTYKSPLADEVKLLYYPEAIVFSPVGNTFYYWARYGNVVSTFITIVEDPETTQITAEDANVVPWSEVERMLKRIDEKFVAAGKEANQ